VAKQLLERYAPSTVKPPPLSRSRVLLALAIAAGVALCVNGGLGADGLLCLAPALLLTATLLLRCYPGERLLAALSGGSHTQRPRTSASRPSLGRPHARVPRGGLLIACALAVRPPPPALTAS
jgi:hypothetical protein